MPSLVKNISLTRKRREPEAHAQRVPDKDRPCPRCLRERGTITMMFFYARTDSTGRSVDVEICSWHGTEIVEKK